MYSIWMILPKYFSPDVFTSSKEPVCNFFVTLFVLLFHLFGLVVEALTCFNQVNFHDSSSPSCPNIIENFWLLTVIGVNYRFCYVWCYKLLCKPQVSELRELSNLGEWNFKLNGASSIWISIFNSAIFLLEHADEISIKEMFEIMIAENSLQTKQLWKSSSLKTAKVGVVSTNRKTPIFFFTRTKIGVKRRSRVDSYSRYRQRGFFFFVGMSTK